MPQDGHGACWREGNRRFLFLGFFKIAWLVFNLVPYVALLIVGKK